jgi:putative phosphoesterase
MKVALIADIHAHLIAMRAVVADLDAWGPDLVIVAGDTVNRGPRPRECLDLVLEREARERWLVIRGNHERYVMNVASDPSARPGLDGDVRESVRWTLSRLGGAREIAAQPEQIQLHAPDGSLIRVVHASIRHDRDNILPDTSDADLRQQIDRHAALFCCGHTHRPLIRQIDSTLLVNAGSVGLPFDRDPRACYARLTWDLGRWRAELARVPYDRDAALRDLRTTGMLEECGATGQIIEAELEDSRPFMARWVELYDQAVVRGEITPEQSVRRFLGAERARG